MQSAYLIYWVTRTNDPTAAIIPAWNVGLAGAGGVGDNPVGISGWVTSTEPPPTPTMGSWNPVTSYNIGDTVASINWSIKSGSTVIYPLVYKSLRASNTGHDPDKWDGWWGCVTQVPALNTVNIEFDVCPFAYNLFMPVTSAQLAATTWTAQLWHSLFWTGTPPGCIVQMIDFLILLNYLNGSEIIPIEIRPQTATATANTSAGNIFNPGVAAQFQCWHTSGLAYFPQLTLSNFPSNLINGLQPTATVGASYVSALTATGGTPPYIFGIIGGQLPPGLKLNPSTGVITGTPTGATPFNFTAQVTDSTGATAQVTCAAPMKCGSAGAATGGAAIWTDVDSA